RRRSGRIELRRGRPQDHRVSEGRRRRLGRRQLSIHVPFRRVRGGHAMKRALAALLFTACGNPATSPAPAALPAEPPVQKPQPGMDLDGPIPLPDRSAPAHHGAMPLLDLAVDRAVVPVSVPLLPLGGSVGFQFADDRAGWVARIPDSVALPTVAYGN